MKILMNMNLFNLSRRCIYVVFLVLFAFWGCSEELVENRMAEYSTRSITSVDEALGDSSIIDSVYDYELVDGTDLLLSIAMVKFNCSELLGVVSAYPTLNEEGQYTRRYYKDGKYRIQFGGTGIYWGEDQIVEEQLPVYPANKIRVPANEEKFDYLSFKIILNGGPNRWEGRAQCIYMRYMLCYLDYTYRYGPLYNSEDDPQHYSCTIQLPIYAYNITGYISIDDCRFSENNRDYGPAYF